LNNSVFGPEIIAQNRDITSSEIIRKVGLNSRMQNRALAFLVRLTYSKQILL